MTLPIDPQDPRSEHPDATPLGQILLIACASIALVAGSIAALVLFTGDDDPNTVETAGDTEPTPTPLPAPTARPTATPRPTTGPTATPTPECTTVVDGECIEFTLDLTSLTPEPDATATQTPTGTPTPDEVEPGDDGEIALGADDRDDTSDDETGDDDTSDDETGDGGNTEAALPRLVPRPTQRVVIRPTATPRATTAPTVASPSSSAGSPAPSAPATSSRGLNPTPTPFPIVYTPVPQAPAPPPQPAAQAGSGGGSAPALTGCVGPILVDYNRDGIADALASSSCTPCPSGGLPVDANLDGILEC